MAGSVRSAVGWCHSIVKAQARRGPGPHAAPARNWRAVSQESARRETKSQTKSQTKNQRAASQEPGSDAALRPGGR